MTQRWTARLPNTQNANGVLARHPSKSLGTPPLWRWHSLTMLLPRVLTAIALLAVLLPALFAATPLPFVVCAWVLLSLAAWEWARLNGAGGRHAVAYGLFCAALCVVAYTLGWSSAGAPVWASVWLLVTAAWVLLSTLSVTKGVTGWRAVPAGFRLSMGLCVLFFAWLSVAQARSLGVNFLLSALALVWVADIGAYAGGRMLSRHLPTKLAPAISPGKTWVGAASGLVASLVLAVCWVALEQRYSGAAMSWGAPSLPARLSQAGVLLMVLGVAAYVALAIVGDLFESLIKRAAGAKDSSALLPGHGGVLDRVDALLPTMPMALMLANVLEGIVR